MPDVSIKTSLYLSYAEKKCGVDTLKMRQTVNSHSFLIDVLDRQLRTPQNTNHTGGILLRQPTMFFSRNFVIEKFVSVEDEDELFPHRNFFNNFHKTLIVARMFSSSSPKNCIDGFSGNNVAQTLLLGPDSQNIFKKKIIFN